MRWNAFTSSRFSLSCPFPVVHQKHARCESEFAGERDHFLSFVRRGRADHPAHRDAKTRAAMIAEGEQAFLEIVEHLLGCFVALHAVDRDLHLLEPRGIQLLDQFRPQEKSIRDHAGAEKAKVPAFAG